MTLPEETTTQLNNLRAAITGKNAKDFEAALEALAKQNQVQAINTYLDGNGLNPLDLAVNLPGPADNFDNYRFQYYWLAVTYKNEDTYGRRTTEEKRKMLRDLDLNPNMVLGHQTELIIPYHRYFTWRLMSFEEISPNTQITNALGPTTALNSVIVRGDVACFNLLMNRPELNVNVILNNNNVLPIHLAVLHQRPNIVRSLVEKGTNLNLRAPINNGQFTPFELAASLALPEIIRILAEYGAGIGASLNPNDPIWGAANLQHCAFFGATDSNGQYYYGQYQYQPLNNQLPGFNHCAISLPWEEKAIEKEGDPGEYIIAKPAFPFLQHYDQLQQRCFELLKNEPNNETYKKLLMYFGAYLPTQEVFTTIVKESNIDGEVIKEVDYEVKITHGTLKSLAAYALATNKDKHQEALNHHYANLVEKNKDKKVDHTEAELFGANDIYKRAIENFHGEDNAQDIINIKSILTHIDQQLDSLTVNRFFTVFTNLSFQRRQRQVLGILFWAGIACASLLLLAFLTSFIIAATLIMPILPAIISGVFTAIICVAPTSIGILLGLATTSALTALSEFARYSVSSIEVLKSLNELANQVQILPSLMTEQTQLLLAGLLDTQITRTQLSHFITTYKQEIQDKLNDHDTLQEALGKDAHVPATAINWQFYPPKREENCDVENQMAKELANLEMGLLEGITSVGG